MPLLKRKAFEKSTVSEYLRDDDEVFHCEVTDEIFKDYEEYCERIILVNSMVWTCEMTGKNNLTYAEALESEKNARKSLKDFPMELRIPILYLAARTKRCSFMDMAEDVFNFVRERYFVGESVEACLEGDIWRESHILSVTAQKHHPEGKSSLPPSGYSYEVEQFEDAESAAPGLLGTAPYDRVRRRKGVYTRDKSRLFLKQFIVPANGGLITIKESALEKYNIHKVQFDQMFTGSPPVFPSSKKLMKNSMSPPASRNSIKPGSASKLNKSLKKVTPDKKGRQESMDKFLKKTVKTEGSPSPKPKTPVDPAKKKAEIELIEKMRNAESMMRQRKEEEKARKKEKTARLQAYMKEWQKVKDDLELEDHKVIPQGTLVNVEGIPHEHFGDFLSVLDFVHTYSDVLKAKDVFHSELDLETFRKALTMKEHAGVFSELVQMFLTAIFSLQEDEAEEYNESGGIQESTEVQQLDTEMATTKAVELATKAGKWSKTYLGTPLSKLPLDPTTVSEVLRLHLLSSGGAAGARCAAWRCHQRGGYSSADDPGLRLRLAHPAALRRLRAAHVADLPLDDKFRILQCLMNQVLSYATVRDIIEEKLDEYRNAKQSLRMLQINERKREAQLATARQELRREAAARKQEMRAAAERARADEQLAAALDALAVEADAKRAEYERRAAELQAQLFEYTTYVGSDRAYRRYWLCRRVGGLFVEDGGEERGPCRAKPLPPPPAAAPAAPAAPADLLAYVTELYHMERERERQRERAGSDKENESGSNSRGGSPKKPLGSVNGVAAPRHHDAAAQQRARDLLVCTADPDTCRVHGKAERPRWWVYSAEAQLDALAAALNRRGAREGELRAALDADRARLAERVRRCPLPLLDGTGAPPPAPSVSTRKRHAQPSLPVAAGASLAEALELALRDHLLELEEKIFHGCLGALKVKDREAWRGTIMLRGYDKQAAFLTWGPRSRYRDDCHLPDGVFRAPADAEQSEVELKENKYRDPGHYLAGGAKPEPGEEGEGGEAAAGEGGEAPPDVVRALAGALLQLAQAVHHKYLKRPLGLDEKERKEREARNRPLELEALQRWEVSLMECRSFAQLSLHLLALDSSVSWSASVLNASCRSCRRRADPDSMLLCDGCNKGHHLYCLKPKLAKVPEGDWFCEQCRPKERTPRKRRKLYTDEDVADTLEDSEGESFSTAVCGACGSGGRLAAACRACAARYHAECAEPRLTRTARQWTCAACLAPAREHSVRRCAATAITNIQQYARALHARLDSSESDDSDNNTPLVKLKGKRSRGSKEPSPLHNGAARRGKRSNQQLNGSARKSKHSLTNGVHEERGSLKKRSGRAEQRAHPELLELLLRDVMRHRDAWPFCEPVSVEEVPDYLDVIETPMDFSAIRDKLARGEYSADEQLLRDAALVFRNCYTYNKDTHPVARAGYRLEKYINKRCSELELPALPETDLEGDEEASKRGLDEHEDAPRPKRPKLK